MIEYNRSKGTEKIEEEETMKIYEVHEYEAGSGWAGLRYYYKNREAAERKLAEIKRENRYDGSLKEIEVSEEE